MFLLVAKPQASASSLLAPRALPIIRHQPSPSPLPPLSPFFLSLQCKESLLEHAKDLALQLVGQARRRRLVLLVLPVGQVLVPGAAPADVVIRVVHGRLGGYVGHDILVEPARSRRPSVTDVGSS